MDKKPTDSTAALSSRRAVMPPPQFGQIPAALMPALRQEWDGTDVDGKILDWIMSHVRKGKRPRTLLMGLAPLLAGISFALCDAVAPVAAALT